MFSGDGLDDLHEAPNSVTDEVVRVLDTMSEGSQSHRRVLTNAPKRPYHFFEVDPEAAPEPYTVVVELQRTPPSHEDKMDVWKIAPSKDLRH